MNLSQRYCMVCYKKVRVLCSSIWRMLQSAVEVALSTTDGPKPYRGLGPHYFF